MSSGSKTVFHEHSLTREFKAQETLNTDCTFFLRLFFSGKHAAQKKKETKEQDVAQVNKNILLLSCQVEYMSP